MRHLTTGLLSCLLLLAVAGKQVLSAAQRPLSPPCFGYAIAAQEDLLLVSAPNVINGGGQAYLFRREGKSHRLLKVVKRPTQWGKNMFGEDVALDRKTLVIGDSGASAAFTTSAGATYLFDMPKLGEPVDKPRRVFPPRPERLAGFGESVALYDDLLAVGESARNDGGSVTLFRRKNDKWTRESTINATQLNSDSMIAAWFGKSVAMNERTLVVGAPWTMFDEVTMGTVFVYEKNDQGQFADAPTTLTWKVRKKQDFFGHSVALEEDLMVVSALLADVGGQEDAGAVCVYVRGSNGRFASEPACVLTADRPRKGAGFGSRVAVSGRRILVGTGKPADGESGVYVFEPIDDDNSKWNQVALLQGTDEAAGFGSWGLAVTNALIYVGEPYSQPYGDHNGQVVVIAREEKEGQVTFRRIETIKMP